MSGLRARTQVLLGGRGGGSRSFTYPRLDTIARTERARGTTTPLTLLEAPKDDRRRSSLERGHGDEAEARRRAFVCCRNAAGRNEALDKAFIICQDYNLKKAENIASSTCLGSATRRPRWPYNVPTADWGTSPNPK
jgi:hypothetical protein